MQHLDEGTIHAWLDGALNAEDARRIEAHLAECATCASAVAEGRGLIAASSRILSALDVVPGDVIPAAPAGATRDGGRAVRGARNRWLPRAARIAAVVCFVAVGATLAARVFGTRVVPVPQPSRGDSRVRPAAPSSAAAPAAQPLQPPSVDSLVARSAPPTVARSKSTAQAETPVNNDAHAAAPVAGKRAAAPVARKQSPSESTVADAGRASAAPAAASPAGALPADTPSAGALPDRTRPAGTPLRLVATEHVVAPDGRVVQRRIYEVSPDVRVTLEEIAASRMYLAPSEMRRTTSEAGARANTSVPAAAPALDVQSERVTAADSLRLNSIQWTDSVGTRFTLSGPLPIEELRRLKGLVH